MTANYFVTIFLLILVSAEARILSADRITFNSTVAVSNFNQFKTNIDKAQEFLIHTYKGVYGGLSAFWFYYSYWLVLSMFYYTFGVTYLNAKDDAEAEIKSHEEQRAFQLSQIDVASIFNKLRSVQEKASSKLGDSCYQRGLCEMRNQFAKTSFYNWIPKFIRKLLRLDPQSREAGTCGEIHSACTLTSIIAALI